MNLRAGWAILGAVLVATTAWAGPTKVDPKKVKTTKSGLKYAILRPGKAPAARKGQEVFVHYTGWLTSGKQFDSSRDRGEPFSFILGGGTVIPGWDEGVQGMLVGETRQLILPPKLAYGDRGAGADIPPKSTLVFEVELLGIGAAPRGPGGGKVDNSKPSKVDDAGIKTTRSGLKYAVLKEGSGEVAAAGQRVSVHYTGWLQSDGSKFDSSLDRGQPFQFSLGRGEVIAGWDEGVAGMKVGEKRQLTIPPSLGYGERGVGPIPPNATLVFEVELLDIRK